MFVELSTGLLHTQETGARRTARVLSSHRECTNKGPQTQREQSIRKAKGSFSANSTAERMINGSVSASKPPSDACDAL